MPEMKIDLVGALQMLLVLVGVFGVYKVIALIFLLIDGSVAQVALSGNVSVPTEIYNTINSTVISISTGYDLINAGDVIVLGLIGLVVILKLFWPLISSYIGTKGSGMSGFN